MSMSSVSCCLLKGSVEELSKCLKGEGSQSQKLKIGHKSLMPFSLHESWQKGSLLSPATFGQQPDLIMIGLSMMTPEGSSTGSLISVDIRGSLNSSGASSNSSSSSFFSKLLFSTLGEHWSVWAKLGSMFGKETVQRLCLRRKITVIFKTKFFTCWQSVGSSLFHN